eukprot:s643_g10.t1
MGFQEEHTAFEVKTPSMAPNPKKLRPAADLLRARALGCQLAVIIRVHSQHIGAPLLGDEMYGGSRVTAHPAAPKRVALHAWRFQAPHPSQSHQLRLEAPFPPDLQSCLKQLTLHWTASSWH